MAELFQAHEGYLDCEVWARPMASDAFLNSLVGAVPRSPMCMANVYVLNQLLSMAELLAFSEATLFAFG